MLYSAFKAKSRTLHSMLNAKWAKCIQCWMQVNVLPAGCIQCWMHQMPVATGRPPAIDLNSTAKKELKTVKNKPWEWSAGCICRCKVHRVHQKASWRRFAQFKTLPQSSLWRTCEHSMLSLCCIELHWAFNAFTQLSIQCSMQLNTFRLTCIQCSRLSVSYEFQVNTWSQNVLCALWPTLP